MRSPSSRRRPRASADRTTLRCSPRPESPGPSPRLFPSTRASALRRCPSSSAAEPGYPSCLLLLTVCRNHRLPTLGPQALQPTTLFFHLLLNRHQALDERLGPRRTAGHVDVDGDHLVDAF